MLYCVLLSDLTPCQPFPRAGQHTQDVSRERNVMERTRKRKCDTKTVENFISVETLGGFRSFYVVISSQKYDKRHIFPLLFPPPPPAFLPLRLLLTTLLHSLTVSTCTHFRASWETRRANPPPHHLYSTGQLELAALKRHIPLYNGSMEGSGSVRVCLSSSISIRRVP